MRIDQLLASATEPVFSFEFFPPKTAEGETSLYEAIEKLRPLDPAFVSVTYGAGGSRASKTLEIAARVREHYGIEAMAHFTCVGATSEQLRSTLDDMQALGLENVLALRGDPPAGQEDWTKTEGGLSYASELVALIRSSYDLCIAAACFPEIHPQASSAEDDLRHLKDKVSEGVGFLVTQLLFDNSAYFNFVKRARDIGITVPIIPGIMPITSFAGIKRMTSLTGASLPEALRRELELRRDDPDAISELGVSFATLQCAELLAGGAPGIHFYTLNRSPSTRAILSALKLAQPWR
jgi:methylenetetrahydrofolate reductase (NADPH)